MNARRLAPIALAALLAVGTTGGVALANNHNDEGNAAALANAKVTLVQAIATAEQQAGGRAVGTGVDNENGRVTIAVEVAAKGGVHTVLIDPATGLVAATRAGGDHEGNDEEND
jgi:uncharacterized membrane protein YkoI